MTLMTHDHHTPDQCTHLINAHTWLMHTHDHHHMHMTTITHTHTHTHDHHLAHDHPPPAALHPPDTADGGYSARLRQRRRLDAFGADYAELAVTVSQQSEMRVRVKVEPVGVQRWEVPEDVVPR